MVTKKLLYWHAFIPVKKKFMVLSPKKKKVKKKKLVVEMLEVKVPS